jgi:hypothetical protein
MNPSFLPLAQAESAPAGGAEIFQVVVATGGALLLTAGLLVVGLGHRSGRIGLLNWADRMSRRLGGDLPGWAGLPAAIALVTLLPALFGLSWDESLHIDDGRDPGPLANPSHYLLLGGLFGIFTAGWIAVVMPARGERPSPAAVRIGPDWYAPVGGVMLLASSSFALLGFPLDDISHRLFGQDVTLWGATHLMMLSGAVCAVLSITVLLAEGRLARRAERDQAPATNGNGVIELLPFGRRLRPSLRRPLDTALVRVLRPLASNRFRMMIAGGGVLAALSIYQGEFDFGVPQFRLLFHPVLLAFAAAVALTMGRIVAGRGAALGAVAFFVLIRGASTLIIGGGFGETVQHFPLYLGEALLVEAVALLIAVREHPYRFGALAGLACGTLGVLAEFGWSQLWMPLPWPAHLLGEALALGAVVGVAGGTIGAFLACGLLLRGDLVGRRPIAAAAVSLATLAGVLVFLGHTSPPQGGAQVTLADVPGTGPREAVATVRFDPATAADDPDWLYAIAWQGGEPLRVEELTAVGPGAYRTPPIPVAGSWKSAIRLQRGSEMGSIPLFAPADAAIPVGEIPAPASFSRAFVDDRSFLQRERKEGVAEWTIIAFGLAVAAFILALLIATGYALVRVARGVPQPEVQPGPPTAARPAPRPAVLTR